MTVPGSESWQTLNQKTIPPFPPISPSHQFTSSPKLLKVKFTLLDGTAIFLLWQNKHCYFLWLPFYSKFSHQNFQAFSLCLAKLAFFLVYTSKNFQCAPSAKPQGWTSDLLARGANDARLSDCSAVSQSSSSLDLDSSSDAKVGKQDRVHS